MTRALVLSFSLPLSLYGQTITACFCDFFFLFFYSFHCSLLLIAKHSFSTYTLCFGQYPINMCCTREINVVALAGLVLFASHTRCVNVCAQYSTQFVSADPIKCGNIPKRSWTICHETFMEFELSLNVIKTNNDFSGRFDRNKAIDFYLLDYFFPTFVGTVILWPDWSR